MANAQQFHSRNNRKFFWFLRMLIGFKVSENTFEFEAQTLVKIPEILKDFRSLISVNSKLLLDEFAKR